MSNNASSIKISYNAKLFRSRVSFSYADTLTSEEPPTEIFTRANERLDAAEKAGEIKYRRLYQERLTSMWQKIRQGKAPQNATEGIYLVSVAAGAPELPGLIVEPSPDNKHLFLLTLPVNQKLIRPWRIEWLKIVISTRLRDLEIQGVPCQAQLYGALIAAQSGRVIKQLPINPTAAPETLPDDTTRPYKLVLNRAREEISVHIYDVLYFRDPSKSIELLRAIDDAAHKASKTSKEHYRVLDKDVTTSLGLAMCGPEALGIDLPFVQLAAATVARRTIYHKNPAAVLATARIYPPDHQHGWQIEWNASGMEAKFRFFDVNLYAQTAVPVSIDWLQDVLRVSGIFAKLTPDIEDEFLSRITRRESLTGMVVAKGEVGAPNSQPYLVAVFEKGLDNHDNSNLRDQQQRQTVRTGQVVAEIRYKKAGKPQRDIFGRIHNIKPIDELAVRVGDGIRQEKDQFIATFAGLPEVIDGDPSEIRLGKSYIHNGDVNLTSGNIVFAGDVKIQGGIETGSLVQVGGNLVVEGSIRGGKIFCGGTVTVSEGISGAGDATIEANGDVTADFVQNSAIICGGNIRINKAIINCQITAVGNIEILNSDGLLLGGNTLCGGSLSCGRIGTAEGAHTTIDLGVNPRHQLRERRLQARFARLQHSLDEDRLALKELSKRRMNQLTQHHQHLKQELTERIQRLISINAKLANRLKSAQAESRAQYNLQATLTVAGSLSENTRLHIAGMPLFIDQDRKNVTLTATTTGQKAS